MLSHTGFPLPNDYGLEDICCVLNRIVELQSDHLHGCDDPSSIPRELLAEHERYVFVLGHFDEQLFVVFLQRACKLQHILVLQPILQRVQYEIDVAIGFEDDELLIHRQLRDRGPIRICSTISGITSPPIPIIITLARLWIGFASILVNTSTDALDLLSSPSVKAIIQSDTSGL
jgi:hypothetical protein